MTPWRERPAGKEGPMSTVPLIHLRACARADSEGAPTAIGPF
jgi:hypothetical protein